LYFSRATALENPVVIMLWPVLAFNQYIIKLRFNDSVAKCLHVVIMVSVKRLNLEEEVAA
ncbi:MAG TPA: hypothetical protein DCM52_05250, partial [Gammaproteobacteria bacterium]|nr:hypothetical protein [Gammaproteobacteria bacterium]HAQ68510.1 hypothetical protein [Gammaproteobacteria bacterium]